MKIAAHQKIRPHPHWSAILFSLFGFDVYDTVGQFGIAEGLVLLLSPLPPLLFLQLRSLAKRARCKYLPHDCLVVGFGIPILAACFVAYGYIVGNARLFGLHIRGDSLVWTITGLLLEIVGFGFALWTLYLLIYFMVAFRTAAAEAKKRWIRDDLSLRQERPLT